MLVFYSGFSYFFENFLMYNHGRLTKNVNRRTRFPQENND